MLTVTWLTAALVTEFDRQHRRKRAAPISPSPETVENLAIRTPRDHLHSQTINSVLPRHALAHSPPQLLPLFCAWRLELSSSGAGSGGPLSFVRLLEQLQVYFLTAMGPLKCLLISQWLPLCFVEEPVLLPPPLQLLETCYSARQPALLKQACIVRNIGMCERMSPVDRPSSTTQIRATYNVAVVSHQR